MPTSNFGKKPSAAGKKNVKTLGPKARATQYNRFYGTMALLSTPVDYYRSCHLFYCVFALYKVEYS